jgi:hypothetical protein
MQRTLSIPAGVSITILIALYSKVLGANAIRDLLTMATLFLPILVYPASLCGLYFTVTKEKNIQSKIGFGIIHIAGLITAGLFAYAWWNFGIPTQR